MQYRNRNTGVLIDKETIMEKQEWWDYRSKVRNAWRDYRQHQREINRMMGFENPEHPVGSRMYSDIGGYVDPTESHIDHTIYDLSGLGIFEWLKKLPKPWYALKTPAEIKREKEIIEKAKEKAKVTVPIYAPTPTPAPAPVFIPAPIEPQYAVTPTPPIKQALISTFTGTTGKIIGLSFLGLAGLIVLAKVVGGRRKAQ